MTYQHSGLNRLASRHGARFLTYAILVGGALLILFPLIWSFSSALKPNNQIFVIPLEWFPREFQWQNFVRPFQEKPFPRYFVNSLFAAGSSVFLTLVVASLAGFSLAKYNYAGKRI